jgi:hypothetical protein
MSIQDDIDAADRAVDEHLRPYDEFVTAWHGCFLALARSLGVVWLLDRMAALHEWLVQRLS